MNTHETPCTPSERQDIIRAAEQRAHYIRWIAEHLLRTEDLLIRKEASKILIQLTESK